EVRVNKRGGVNSISIRKTDGTIEKYDLNKPEEKEAFEKKYGKLTPPPPPPPPTPPSKNWKAPSAPAPVKGKAPMPPPPPPPAPEIIEDSAVVVSAVGIPTQEVVVTGVSAKNRAVPVERVKVMGTATREKTITMVGTTTNSKVVERPKRLTLNVGDKEPLVMLDGKAIPYAEVSNIPPNNISHINVLKDAAAVSVYGEKAKDGVILITTKGSVEISKKQDDNFADNICNLDALIFIDGKKVPCQEARSFLKANKEKVASVEVYKGADKVKKATGEDAPNAIIIKTKQITD
ncbi:MAG: TonB-dependent receptor plug domain-containing protein, partial [Chitinophagaceae bacterium]|nr:TonB-dependent receptor plug domain-containing protein [Chitinophagaceae bacterium]